MGVSDEIFFIIVGSIGAAFLAAIGGAIVIRKRMKKRRQVANKNIQQKIAGITMQRQRQNGMQAAATGFAPLMTNPTQGMMPYTTTARMPTMGNMMSMARPAGTVFPMTAVTQPRTGMQPMTGMQQITRMQTMTGMQPMTAIHPMTSYMSQATMSRTMTGAPTAYRN